MARRSGLPALLLVLVLAFGGCAAMRELDSGYSTESGEDASYYYDDLASYGAWVNVPGYGLVWCPEVAAAWQPYTVGYWLYTEDGWFWAAEDPWGSIPYHYGRWAFDDDYGWVWVPDDVWAPAWVAWRYGSGWVGWAPLPPDIAWRAHDGIDCSPDDLDRRIRHRLWSFTKAEDFGTQRMRHYVEPFDKNERLVKQTRNVTKYAAGSHPVESGMSQVLLPELREKKAEPYRIVDTRKPLPKSGLRIRGKELEVNRPTAEVKAAIRDRVRKVSPEERAKPTSPTSQSVSQEREKPEIQVAQREDGARVTPRSPEVATREERPRERQESLRERVEAARGQEKAAQQREEAAQQREQAAQQREQAAHKREQAAQQREEAAQKREEAAQQREHAAKRETAAQRREEAAKEREEAARQREEAVRQREEASQAREKNASHEEPEATADERKIRERDSRKGTKDFDDREREIAPKRVRGGPTG